MKKIGINIWFLLVCFLSTSAWALSDPTRPYSHLLARSGASGLVLNSLLVSEGRKVAIINNEKVYVGDTVGSSLVTEINDAGVLLKGRQGTQYLGLSQQPVKSSGF